MKQTIFVLSLLPTLVLIQPGMAANKVRDWQTGRLLDSERNRYFAGTVGNAMTIPGAYGATTTNASQDAVYRVYETFVIEGDQYVYQAQERLHWRWSKPANLTVNGSVKFAVEKQKLFVLDEDGKEHEMEIIQKALRQDTPKNNLVQDSPGSTPPQSKPVAEPDIGGGVKQTPEAPKAIAQSPGAPNVTSGERPQLVITSMPTGAQIEVNGEFIGNTPSTITAKEGSVTVTVKKSGYQAWQRTLTLSPGDKRTLEAELVKNPNVYRID